MTSNFTQNAESGFASTQKSTQKPSDPLLRAVMQNRRSEGVKVQAAEPPSRGNALLLELRDPLVTPESFDERLAEIAESPILAIDTETTGLHPWSGDYVTGICTSVPGLTSEDPPRASYFPLRHPRHPLSGNLRGDQFARLLAELERNRELLVWHNVCFDWAMMRREGWMYDGDLARDSWDTMAVAWLLDENEPSFRLKSLANKYVDKGASEAQDELKRLMRPHCEDCGATGTKWLVADSRKLWTETRVVEVREVERRDGQVKQPYARVCRECNSGRLLGGRSWADVYAHEIAPYGANDAAITLRLQQWQQKRLAGDPELTVAANRERTYLGVVYEMICHGVQIDRAAVRAGLERELEVVRRIDTQFQTEHGIDINSNPQLVELLYSRWRLRPPKLTDKGNPQVDREALERLAEIDPRVEPILEYRRAHKASRTYYRPMLEFSDERGRIHPSFRPHGTVTGRACVTADTLIEMPRDLTAHPDGVPISQVRPGDWVYSFDWQRRLVLRRVKWVGITGRRRVVRLTARAKDGHEVSVCLTPDHLVRLRNGDWRAAGSLLDKTRGPRRLMCMVRRAVSDDGYAYFFPNSVASQNGKMAGGRNREHRWVLGQVYGRPIHPGYDVHHRDGNRLNNHPDNLESMHYADHRGMHKPRRATPEVVRRWLDGEDVGMHPKTLRRRAREYGMLVEPSNHVVVSIEDCGVEEVWDLEVEDTHAFIGNGICLHNSCAEPNLQTIPQEYTLDGVRDCFIADPGYELWEYDLGQAELRVACDYAQDETMREHLSSGDIHTSTARLIFNKSDPQYRRIAKNLNFGFIYGIGPSGFTKQARKAGDLAMTVDIARDLLNRYAQTYPRLRETADYVERVARERGYVKLWPVGRRRRFRTPAVKTPDYRKAFNSVVQGGVAEYVKELMICLAPLAREQGVRLVLMVHDSLVFEIPDGGEPQWSQTVREVAEEKNPFGIPMPIEGKPWRKTGD